MQLRSLLLIVVVVTLLSTTLVFGQVDSFMTKVRADFEKIEQRKALRTNDENKLFGSLYDLLHLAEGADSSISVQEQYIHRTTLYKNKKLAYIDAEGRIRVVILLSSLDDTTNIKQIIQTLDGVVEQVGLVPFIGCRILPKYLRSLIQKGSIRNIKVPSPGTTGSLIVR